MSGQGSFMRLDDPAVFEAFFPCKSAAVKGVFRPIIRAKQTIQIRFGLPI